MHAINLICNFDVVVEKRYRHSFAFVESTQYPAKEENQKSRKKKKKQKENYVREKLSKKTESKVTFLVSNFDSSSQPKSRDSISKTIASLNKKYPDVYIGDKHAYTYPSVLSKETTPKKESYGREKLSKKTKSKVTFSVSNFDSSSQSKSRDGISKTIASLNKKYPDESIGAKHAYAHPSVLSIETTPLESLPGIGGQKKVKHKHSASKSKKKITSRTYGSSSTYEDVLPSSLSFSNITPSETTKHTVGAWKKDIVKKIDEYDGNAYNLTNILNNYETNFQCDEVEKKWKSSNDTKTLETHFSFNDIKIRSSQMQETFHLLCAHEYSSVLSCMDVLTYQKKVGMPIFILINIINNQ